MSNLTEQPIWKQLQLAAEAASSYMMPRLFEESPDRARDFSLDVAGLHIDYSKHLLTQSDMDQLIELAEAQQVEQWRNRMFAGEKINVTEDRAVLHTALRAPDDAAINVDGHNVIKDVHSVLDRMEAFVNDVHFGDWVGFTGKKIRDIVNIGIGGSDLGPKMVCSALKQHCIDGMRVHFVSTIDVANLQDVVEELDAETTLFVIESKTFTTQETMMNAHSARAWFLEQTENQGDISKHFVAASTNLEGTREFGIGDAQVFEFWDWVGGRYSLWSAIGLPIALYIGMENFRRLLAGAHAMDKHFVQAPLSENAPVLLALIGVWYRNFMAFPQYLVLPYNYAMRSFPAYIQQMDMESNGKSVRRDGSAVDYATGPTVWGELGSNAQHAFYQLVHQGTDVLPADLIIAADAYITNTAHNQGLAANYIAQSEAMMNGRDADIVRSEVGDDTSDADINQRLMPGNRPSTSIVMAKLDPFHLGALISLYEHKIFVQGVIWEINSYDQWGVELGKKLAKAILPKLDAEDEVTGHDGSTSTLISHLRGH